jgi:hypothetical protein
MGKIVTGVSLLVLSLSIANAEDYFASVSKYEDKDGKKSMTAKYIKMDPDAAKGKGKGKGGFKGPDFTDAESKTFVIHKDVKVMKRQFNKDDMKVETIALEDGLKNKMFSEATTEKPLTTRIKTNDKGEIIEISVGGGGGGFNKKKKKNDTSY